MAKGFFDPGSPTSERPPAAAADAARGAAPFRRFLPHWRSVRLRIGAAFSVLALVLFVGVGAVSGEQARRQSEDAASASLQRLADRLARTLDAGMAERLREVRNLSTLENILDTELEPAQWRLLVERMQASLPHYTWIGVTDTSGKVLAATQGLLEGRDVSKRPWFAGGLARPFVGDIHEALLLESLLKRSADAEPLRLVDFAAPMQLRGRTTGVLGAHLSWNWVEERRREAIRSVRADREVDIVLTDPEGTALLRPGLPTLPTPGRTALDAAREAVSTIAWPDGVRYLTAASASTANADYPGMSWRVVVRQPESTATAAATALKHRIWAAGGLGALIFGVVGWWLAGRLTAPLRSLAREARVATADAPAGGKLDEVEQLAGALGALIERLRQRDRELTALNGTLEGRVQQRTESLRRANDDLQSFSRSVSHDLRGPIGSIGLVLRNVLGQPDLDMPERPRLLLSEVARECDRLKVLIEELMTLSMVEQRELAVVSTSMRSLVQAVLDELARGGASETVAQTVVVGELPEVQGDAVLLRQVWHNLLSNAVKFTGRVESPRIEVTAQDAGDERVFCVADNGAGFDTSQAARLFGVFQRLHRASDFPGTGVGLSIVKRVVHRHGGRVWAESKPGEGARFYFALPKAPTLLSSTSA